MDWIWLAALIIEVPLIAAIVVGLRKLNALRAELEALTKRQGGQADDIAGLCSAALSVDQRLAQDEQRLGELYDWMESQRTQDKLNQPYHVAIDLIRRGGTAAQLVAQCGISHEEAALLLRLHGGGLIDPRSS